jgi:glucokinase
MNYGDDNRIVMTLDAGGTNFVFSALRGNEEIIDPFTLPSNGHDLDLCLETIVRGFTTVKKSLAQEPAAISFAFPGPADYPLGIIGDLGNLPGFRGGVPLGPMLQEQFNMPVFINNDGDLFTYGEAIAGFLPYINSLLEASGSPRRFHNLVGITVGTGLGGGIVRNGRIFLGDNSASGEAWLLRNKLDPATNAEEGASIRAVQNAYASLAHIKIEDTPSPKDIYKIANSLQAGKKEAAVSAFERLGEVVGDALANVLTMIDGLAVIGGGLVGAHSLFLPRLVKEMNTPFVLPDGQRRPRLVSRVYNLEDERERGLFIRGDRKMVKVPVSGTSVTYDPLRRLGVGISRLGTSEAVSIGAYTFALRSLDNPNQEERKKIFN